MQAQEQLRALQERCERAELDGQRASSRLELLRTALTAAQQEARTAAQDAEAARASVTQRDAEAAREREAAAQQVGRKRGGEDTSGCWQMDRSTRRRK